MMRELREAILRYGRVVVDSNGMDLLHHACETGLGLAALPRYMVGEAVAQGRLVPVLADSLTVEIPLWAVAPVARFGSANVSAIMEALRGAA